MQERKLLLQDLVGIAAACAENFPCAHTASHERGAFTGKFCMSIKLAIRKSEVKRRTTLSNTQLHVLIKKGDFPAPGYASARVPIWDSEQIDSWIASRLATAKAPADSTPKPRTAKVGK